MRRRTGSAGASKRKSGSSAGLNSRGLSWRTTGIETCCDVSVVGSDIVNFRKLGHQNRGREISRGITLEYRDELNYSIPWTKEAFRELTQLARQASDGESSAITEHIQARMRQRTDRSAR